MYVEFIIVWYRRVHTDFKLTLDFGHGVQAQQQLAQAFAVALVYGRQIARGDHGILRPFALIFAVWLASAAPHVDSYTFLRGGDNDVSDVVVGIADVLKVLQCHCRHAANRNDIAARKFRIRRQYKARLYTAVDRRDVVQRFLNERTLGRPQRDGFTDSHHGSG